MNVAIIGGGAAGYFSAITVKENYPTSNVVILEKSNKVLSKVKISGGGRCNVTNACESDKKLLAAYPRGTKLLKKAFRVFNNKDAINWFESRGVSLVTQEDNCIFPETQNSQTIIDCFQSRAKDLGIDVKLKHGVSKIQNTNSNISVSFIDNTITPIEFNKVIITTGGSPKPAGLEWLKELGHKIEYPVPSLFTFNMPNEDITDLMGIVVNEASVTIQGTKIKSKGPLLITHWGMSGPAILIASAYGARILHEKNYKFNIHVNWIGTSNQKSIMEKLKNIIINNKQKHLSNIRPYSLPDRLWTYLITKADIPLDKKCIELGKKDINRIIEVLSNDIYFVSGKTTFKEEFVTCGGVSLDSINSKSMQSNIISGLYFAGEILDIDGITGGFNFQAAWTTAYIAGKLQ